MHIRTFATAATAVLGIAGIAAAQQFTQQTASLFPVQLEYSNQITSLDIDADGDLDLLFANGQGYSSQGAALKPRIYVNRINEATAKFVDETDARAPGVTGWFRGIEAGDCDGDGDWDLVLANDFNKQPLLLINDGAGNFANETAARLPVLTMSAARAQFGDVDNDGDLDLFFNNSGATNRFGTGQPRLFLNNGAGVYSNVTATNIPAGNIADQQDCIFGDVDGDLDLDIHIASRTGAAKLWLNNGAGVFTNFVFPSGGASYSYDFGDIDGDGDLDMLSINGGADQLLQNNMPAAWTVISAEISPNTAIDDNDSKFFDYDNDGDLDYIVASLGSGERVFRNNGGVAADPGALFTQITNGAAGVIPNVSDASLDVEVADYNGDGKLDIVTAQGESGNFQNKIYINGAAGPADTIAPKIVEVEAISDVAYSGSPVGPFVVRAVIYDGHTSDRGFYPGPIALNFTVGGVPQSVEMAWVGNSMWRGVIPAIDECGSVEYSVSASDRVGNTAQSPASFFDVLSSLSADFNNDCVVDGGDLGTLLAAWGNPGGPEDLNGDGTVDGADLGLLLTQFS